MKVEDGQSDDPYGVCPTHDYNDVSQLFLKARLSTQTNTPNKGNKRTCQQTKKQLTKKRKC